MKASKIVVALASLTLLASCGGNSSTSTESSEPASSSSAAAKTMAFLNDGQYYMDVPAAILAAEEPEKTPRIKINGVGITGDRTDNLEGKFVLSAEGTFAKDVYLTIAKSDAEGHIAAKAYGAIPKDRINETLEIVNSYVGVPNKVFIAFSLTKATWPKNFDKEMDQEIEVAWGLVG